jgi:hypothetical protein
MNKEKNKENNQYIHTKQDNKNDNDFHAQYIYHDHKIMENSTIAERLKNLLYTDFSTQDIIEFLAKENAYFLTLNYDDVQSIPIQMRENYLNFYFLFSNTVEEETRQARLENWNGIEPLIIRVAQCIVEDQESQIVQKYLSKVDKNILDNSEELAKIIMNIKKNTTLFSWVNKENISMDIPATIEEDDKEFYYKRVLYIIAKVILNDGGLLVRYEVNKKNELEYHVFAIKSQYGSTWYPISKERLKKSKSLLNGEERKIIFEEIEKNNKNINLNQYNKALN